MIRHAALLVSKFTRVTPTEITNQLLNTTRTDAIAGYDDQLKNPPLNMVGFLFLFILFLLLQHADADNREDLESETVISCRPVWGQIATESDCQIINDFTNHKIIRSDEIIIIQGCNGLIAR